MSELHQYRVVDLSSSRIARTVQAIRSYWKGPYTLSSITKSLFSDSPAASAGVAVSEQTALTYSAFWACVNAISTDVASLPLIVYKRAASGGKERYTDGKLYRLLHDEPNPEMTAITMRQTMTAHTLTWGNGYAEIERDVQGKPHYLWPITPDRVAAYRTLGGDVAYKVRRADGTEDAIPAANMLHIPGLGFDGMTGYSVVAHARESIGLALATERFGATFFGNGATFGGVIAYKGPKPPATSEKNLEDVLAAKHQGVDKAHKLLALYNDATYTRMGIPPNDAQFLETRLHQVEEMCRWFRMPPHKIQHLLRSTNNNIEHQGIEYYTDTMRPWTVRWEQECNRKLIAPSERRIQFVEHMIDGVLRGDITSRYAAYAVGRQWGWMSANDVRDKENMNPLTDGGDIYLVPMNMAPANRINDLIDKQVEPTPVPVAPAPADTKAANEANARATAAEQSAIEAREHAQRETEQRIAAEATGTATAAELEQRKVSEAAAIALAAQLTALATDVRTQADQAEARAATLAQELSETAKRAGTAAGERDHALAVVKTHEAALLDVEAKRQEAERALTEAEAKAADEVDAVRARADADVVAVQRLAAATRADALAALTSQQDAEAKLAEVAQRAETEAAARADAETALATQQAAERDRMTGVIAAHRGLIVDAVTRMIRRETGRARLKQATQEKLREWAGHFYALHEQECCDALLPAIRTHLAWKQSDEDPLVVVRGYVAEHIATSTQELRAVLDSDPAEFADRLETMLRRWETARPELLADVILRDEVQHVAR